jgi:hypothetical protein
VSLGDHNNSPTPVLALAIPGPWLLAIDIYAICSSCRCVRASYDKDDTNGFFVARFERSIGSGGADSKVADKATMNTTTPSTFSKSGKLSAKEASEGERSREQATKKDKHAIPKRVEQYVPAVAAQLSKRGAVQGDSDGGKKKRKKGAGESSLPPPKRSGLAKAAVDVD